MGLGQEMKNLTQDIITSYDDRVGRIAAIKEETAGIREKAVEMIKSFQKAHEDMSRKLRKSLANSESQRLKDFKAMFKTHHAMIKTIQARDKERRKQVNSVLDGFHKERKEMASHWEDLSSTIMKKKKR